jgi:hypothetical protein
VGGLHEGQQDLVDDTPGGRINEVAEVKAMGAEDPGGTMRFEQFLNDLGGLWAANPDDPDTGLAKGGGNGSDRILGQMVTRMAFR